MIVENVVRARVTDRRKATIYNKKYRNADSLTCTHTTKATLSAQRLARVVASELDNQNPTPLSRPKLPDFTLNFCNTGDL